MRPFLLNSLLVSLLTVCSVLAYDYAHGQMALTWEFAARHISVIIVLTEIVLHVDALTTDNIRPFTPMEIACQFVFAAFVLILIGCSRKW